MKKIIKKKIAMWNDMSDNELDQFIENTSHQFGNVPKELLIKELLLMWVTNDIAMSSFDEGDWQKIDNVRQKVVSRIKTISCEKNDDDGYEIMTN